MHALLGLAGSVIASGRRIVLALGGILVLLSIIVFAAGLQNQISSAPLFSRILFPITYLPGIGLFSISSYSILGISITYFSCLFFGFWLALVAAIIMFATLTRKPAEAIPPPQPSPPPPK